MTLDDKQQQAKPVHYVSTQTCIVGDRGLLTAAGWHRGYPLVAFFWAVWWKVRVAEAIDNGTQTLEVGGCVQDSPTKAYREARRRAADRTAHSFCNPSGWTPWRS